MSWQLSSLRTTEQLRLSVSLRSVACRSPSSSCNFPRGITPTRTFRAARAALAPDSTSTGDEHGGNKRRHGQTLPETAFSQTLGQATNEQWTNARCIQLLTTRQNESGQDRVNSLVGQTVGVHGMIRSIRKHKHGAFAHVTDGSCFEPIQVVLSSELVGSLNNGTALRVVGEWKLSPARGQAYELLAERVDNFGTTDIESYPIQKKYQTTEFLRSFPHLRVRIPFNLVLARFRSECLFFLNRHLPLADYGGGHFVQVQPPVITSSDCEGAGEVFTLRPNAEASACEQDQDQKAASDLASFFRGPKYLTVSSQLHLEAYAAALQNVWTLSPTFRAEKSDTPRHLAEFYMLEVEMSFITSVQALTDLVEHLIRSLVNDERVQAQQRELLHALRASQGLDSKQRADEVEERWNALRGEPWKQVTYTYCMERLRQAGHSNPLLFAQQPVHGSSLQLEHERWIAEHLGLNRPIFVTHYPKATKPFYMAPSGLADDNPAKQDEAPSTSAPPGTVACFDLLMPFGTSEIAGGSLREHRLEQLIAKMRHTGMLSTANPTQTNSSSNPSDEPSSNTAPPVPYPFLHPTESLGPLRWYADLRRHGTTPHGGFGIGWDRLLGYLTGMDNLRDVVPFPRSYGRADC